MNARIGTAELSFQSVTFLSRRHRDSGLRFCKMECVQMGSCSSGSRSSSSGGLEGQGKCP